MEKFYTLHYDGDECRVGGLMSGAREMTEDQLVERIDAVSKIKGFDSTLLEVHEIRRVSVKRVTIWKVTN